MTVPDLLIIWLLITLDLLQSAGQDINHRNKWLDGAIHILLYNFQCSLEDAEEEFQVIGVQRFFGASPTRQMSSWTEWKNRSGSSKLTLNCLKMET